MPTKPLEDMRYVSTPKLPMLEMVDSNEILAALTEPSVTCSTSPTAKACEAKVFKECLTLPD